MLAAVRFRIDFFWRQPRLNGMKGDPQGVTCFWQCSAPGSLDTSLSHAAGLIEIAACHA